MKKTNIKLTSLALRAGADDPVVLQNFFKVVAENIRARGVLPELLYPTTILDFLRSPENRTSGYFDMSTLAVAYEESLATGKKGWVAKGRFMPPLPEEFTQAEVDYCATGGDSLKYRNFAYNLDRRIASKPIEVDMGYVRCIQENRAQYVADILEKLFQNAASSLAAAVANEVLSGKYIGNLPSRTKGVERVTDTICAFLDGSYNGINPTGEAVIEEDMMLAGVQPASVVWFGTTRGKQYANMKALASPNTTGGYDPSRLDTLNPTRFRYDYFVENKLGTGKILVIRPGALQFVAQAKNVGDFIYSSDSHKRITVVDPYFGLTWDLIENVQTCEEEIKTTWQVVLHYGILGYPACDYPELPLRHKVKDVFIYTLDCCDATPCDIDPVKGSMPVVVSNYNNSCDIDETCERACSLTITQDVNEDGDLTILALYTPANGDTETPSYVFTVNGVPLSPQSDNYIVLAAGSYDNGQTVSVAVNTTICQATASLVIDAPCAAMLVFINLLSGYQPVVANGTYAGSGFDVNEIIGELRIENGGTNGVTLEVSSIVDSSGNVVITGDVPASIAQGNNELYTIFAGPALTPGNYTANISIVSNDCNTPAFVFNVTFTITS